MGFFDFTELDKSLQQAVNNDQADLVVSLIEQLPVERTNGAAMLAARAGHLDLLADLLSRCPWTDEEACRQLWRAVMERNDLKVFDVVHAHALAQGGHHLLADETVTFALNCAMAERDEGKPHQTDASAMIERLAAHIHDPTSLRRLLRRSFSHRVQEVMPLLLRSPAAQAKGVDAATLKVLLALTDHVDHVEPLMQACSDEDLNQVAGEYMMQGRDNKIFGYNHDRYPADNPQAVFLTIMTARRQRDIMVEAVGLGGNAAPKSKI